MAVVALFAERGLRIALVGLEIQVGVFVIRFCRERVGDRLVWSRKVEGGFPEIKVLKQRVRDAVAPDKDLGHADRAT